MPATATLPPRLLRLTKALQLLSGLFAMLMVPLLWAAWSQFMLVMVLCAIFGCVAVFTVLNYILHRYDNAPS